MANIELYAALRYYISPHGYVEKDKLPSLAQICEIVGIKSVQTLKVHLKGLIDEGLIVDRGDKYTFPPNNDIFMNLPLATIQFLKDVIPDKVTKLYLLLGEHKYGHVYEPHELGMKNERELKHSLMLLRNEGLISYEWLPGEKVRLLRWNNAPRFCIKY